jgi:hypothetical protein
LIKATMSAFLPSWAIMAMVIERLVLLGVGLFRG